LLRKAARDDRGAFVVGDAPAAEGWSDALAAAGVVTDARGPYLRLCPDLLTTEAEIVAAADAVRRLRARRPDDQSDDENQRHDEYGRKRDAHEDHLVRLDRSPRPLRMASRLRMPKKLQNTVPSTSRSRAGRGGGTGSSDGMRKSLAWPLRPVEKKGYCPIL
jgi:hypothetical protein